MSDLRPIGDEPRGDGLREDTRAARPRPDPRRAHGFERAPVTELLQWRATVRPVEHRGTIVARRPGAAPVVDLARACTIPARRTEAGTRARLGPRTPP